jgi:hypothetical protein
VGLMTVTQDVLLTAVVVGLLAMGYLIVHVTRAAERVLQPTLPVLPEEDHPPAGLGRLVPVGAQVEQECRRGVVTLELWLAAHRRRTVAADRPPPRPAVAPGQDGSRAADGAPRNDDAQRRDRGAQEAG